VRVTNLASTVSTNAVVSALRGETSHVIPVSGSRSSISGSEPLNSRSHCLSVIIISLLPRPNEIVNRVQTRLHFLLIWLAGLYKPASFAPINPARYDLSSTNERAEIIG
jgi:hypothetical protein